MIIGEGVMLKMFLGFMPWIFFSFVDSALSALIASVILCINELHQKFIFAWGTVFFFLLYFILEHFFSMEGYKITIESLGLLSISLTSLCIHTPFTMDYARLFTPQMAWRTPVFFKINQSITRSWSLLFFLSAIVNNAIVTNIFFVLGFLISVFFPNFYNQQQRRIANQNNPFLQGNFAPIREENDFFDLVIEGDLPELFPKGAYLRNGPNLQFEPISYVYPFDGDGMIHAIYFNDNCINYKNRYVKTISYEVEKRAGKALYGGIKMPLPIDKKYFLNGETNSPFKNGAFIHVVPFANKIIALLEANPAYVLDEELNTLGLFKAGQKIAPNINAHVKICPESKQMFAISYDLNPPYLVLHQFTANGELLQTIVIDKPKPTMIHDFVITKNHVIIFDCPVVFDIEAAMKGDSVLQWHEEQGVDIRIFNRDNLQESHKIIHSKAFFVFHFANAYEQEKKIVINYIYYDYLNVIDDAMHIPGMNLHQMTINLVDETFKDITLSDMQFEFPTINLKYLGKHYQYIYGICRKHQHIGPIRFDSIVKYNRDSNVVTMHDFGSDFEIGETIFVNKTHSQDEDDGYLLVHAYQLSSNNSYLYILDAKDLKKKPCCRILLPKRVPFGLHGSWVEYGVEDVK